MSSIATCKTSARRSAVRAGQGRPTLENCFLATSTDAALVVEACRVGLLSPYVGRPASRDLERSGAVYVFSVSNGGVDRWRVPGGIIWSDSSDLPGGFFVYRETTKKSGVAEMSDAEKAQEKAQTEQLYPYLGHQIGKPRLRPGGMVKKQISFSLRGEVWRVVAYYNLPDAMSGMLLRPRRARVELRTLQLSPVFWDETNRSRLMDDDGMGGSNAWQLWHKAGPVSQVVVDPSQQLPGPSSSSSSSSSSLSSSSSGPQIPLPPELAGPAFAFAPGPAPAFGSAFQPPATPGGFLSGDQSLASAPRPPANPAAGILPSSNPQPYSPLPSQPADFATWGNTLGDQCLAPSPHSAAGVPCLDQAPLEGLGQAPLAGFGQAPLAGFGQAPLAGFGQVPLEGFGQTPLEGFDQELWVGQDQSLLGGYDQTLLAGLDPAPCAAAPAEGGQPQLPPGDQSLASAPHPAAGVPYPGQPLAGLDPTPCATAPIEGAQPQLPPGDQSLASAPHPAAGVPYPVPPLAGLDAAPCAATPAEGEQPQLPGGDQSLASAPHPTDASFLGLAPPTEAPSRCVNPQDLQNPFGRPAQPQANGVAAWSDPSGSLLGQQTQLPARQQMVGNGYQLGNAAAGVQNAGVFAGAGVADVSRGTMMMPPTSSPSSTGFVTTSLLSQRQQQQQPPPPPPTQSLPQPLAQRLQQLQQREQLRHQVHQLQQQREEQRQHQQVQQQQIFAQWRAERDGTSSSGGDLGSDTAAAGAQGPMPFHPQPVPAGQQPQLQQQVQDAPVDEPNQAAEADDFIFQFLTPEARGDPTGMTGATAAGCGGNTES